jgi:hypothetical protein
MTQFKNLFLFMAVFSVFLLIDCASGDDDDEEETDDQDVDDDDNLPDDTCETPEVRQNIEWLFESCYSFPDAQDDPILVDDVCELSPSAIECYNDCAEKAEECGGDEDPLLGCMIDCGLDDLSA